MAEGVEEDDGVCSKKMEISDDHIRETRSDDRIESLLNNDLMSDIKFLVNGERFHAHKFVLSYASEVFYTMFYGPLADDSKEIEIADCEKPEYFLEFLSMIYKKSAKVTWDNIQQLSYLRKKYMINETRPFSNFIQSTVDTENCLEALDTSVALEEDDMIEECLKVIRRDISVLVNSERFLELKQPALKAIVKQNMLNIVELDLFNAVDRWCSYQVDLQRKNEKVTKKREVLGDALYHIRFPLIKLEDFTMCCRPSRILTNKEIVDLYDILVLTPEKLGDASARKSYDEDVGNINENGPESDKLAASFIAKPRVKGNTIVCTIDVAKHYAFPRYVAAYCDTLLVSVNTKAWLVGLKLIGPWIGTIKINETTFILSHKGNKDKCTQLQVPTQMQPCEYYLIVCEKVFTSKNSNRGCFSTEPIGGSSTVCGLKHVDPFCEWNRGLDIPIKYKWNGFECTIRRPKIENVLIISQLIFSTFDDTAMDHDIPLLNMMAT